MERRNVTRTPASRNAEWSKWLGEIRLDIILLYTQCVVHGTFSWGITNRHPTRDDSQSMFHLSLAQPLKLHLSNSSVANDDLFSCFLLAISK